MAEERSDERERLDEEATQIERLRRGAEQRLASQNLKDASGETSIVDQYDADVSAVTEQRELDESVRELLDKEAGEVAEARLQARPQATLCIDCERALEARTPRRGGSRR